MPLENTANISDAFVQPRLCARILGCLHWAFVFRHVLELVDYRGKLERHARVEQLFEFVVIVEPPSNVGEQLAAGGHLLLRAKPNGGQRSDWGKQLLEPDI